MLRKTLIGTGLFIAFLPYLGFPYSWQRVLFTALGLFVALVVLLARHHRVHRDMREEIAETPRALHVERREVEDRPRMHVEREIIVDTEQREESPDTETTVEKKVTVVRRRKKSEGAPGNERAE